MKTFMEVVKECLTTKKYYSYKGRAVRSEYWWFELFWWVIIFALVIVGEIIDSNSGLLGALVGIFMLFTFLPRICLLIRRLHDAGFSGWFSLLGLIPYVGPFIILYVVLQKSDGDNQYGLAQQA